MRFRNFHIIILCCTSAIIISCGSQKNQNTCSQKAIDSISVQHKTTDSTAAENISPVNSDTPESLSENNFDFISATSQKWQGGVKGSGRGINYVICLRALGSSSQLIIDQLWVGQTFHKISASRKFPKTSADGFSTGDTIYIFTNDYFKGSDKIEQIESGEKQNEVQEAEKDTPPPYIYTGEALIGYKINGNRKYKEIAKITAKSPLFYP